MRRAPLLLLVLAGCAGPPPPMDVELDVPPPPAWTANADADTTRVTPGWWRTFGDTQLDSLVTEAILYNADLSVAASRVDAALASARIAGAEAWPWLNADFTALRQKQNFIGLPIPGEDVLSNTTSSFGLSLQTSWEIDIWGRLRARQAAALADVQVSRAAFEAGMLSLAGLVTKSWFAVIEARQQVELAEATMESFRVSAETVRNRFNLGVRSSLDLRLALTQYAASQALYQLRRQQLDASTRQLEILLNRYPSAALTPAAVLPDPPQAIPAGIPAEVVSRRPDLVAAERRLAASDRRWAEAKRSLYPRLALTGSIGTSSNELGDLLDGDFGVWNLVGNLLQPIFQGGRLRANVALQDALTDQALAEFASAVLAAYAEVEQGLAAEAFLVQREAALIDAANQSSGAERVALEQYRAGIIDYVTLQQTQRDALDARSALLTIRRDRLTNRVDLYMALGGGFEMEDALSIEPVARSTEEQRTEDNGS